MSKTLKNVLNKGLDNQSIEISQHKIARKFDS